MTWREDYLANLMRMMDADGETHNREFLAMLRIEKMLRNNIETYIEAAAKAEKEPALYVDGTPMLDQQQLVDLYAMAFVDDKLAEAEDSLLDMFAQASKIPEGRLRELRQLGEERARRLIEEALRDAGVKTD